MTTVTRPTTAEETEALVRQLKDFWAWQGFDSGDKEYDPDQPRDELGRWTDSGSDAPSIEPTPGGISPHKMELDSTWLSTHYAVSPDQMTQNVRSLLDQATATDRIAGMRWYNDAHQDALRLSEQYGITPDQAAGVLAAVSPQTIWTYGTDDPTSRTKDGISNRATAERLTMMATGRWDSDKFTVTEKSVADWKDKALERAGTGGTEKQHAERVALIEQKAAYYASHLGERQTSTTPPPVLAEFHPDIRTLHQNAEKALSILHGADPEKLLSGPKVRSFYDNIRNPQTSTSVTIDSHMVNAVVSRDAGPTLSASFGGHPGAYVLLSNAIRSAAVSEGMRPHQAQAVAWLVQHRVDLAAPRRSSDD